MRTTTAGAKFLAYAVVTDNVTGDPTYVPTRRSGVKRRQRAAVAGDKESRRSTNWALTARASASTAAACVARPRGLQRPRQDEAVDELEEPGTELPVRHRLVGEAEAFGGLRGLAVREQPGALDVRENGLDVAPRLVRLAATSRAARASFATRASASARRPVAQGRPEPEHVVADVRFRAGAVVGFPDALPVARPGTVARARSGSFIAWSM